MREHTIILRDGNLALRPMTEDDWELVLRINNYPEVGYFAEGDAWQEKSLDELQRIYRSISENAVMFVIELDGRPIGDCWLQRMNLERLRDQYPPLDCRRIDLAIGEQGLWGRGLGSRVIGLLVQFGFDQEQADAIFACDVWDYNVRSRRAFEKAGFRVVTVREAAPGSKGRSIYDLAIFRDDADEDG